MLVFTNYRFEPTVLVRHNKKYPLWDILFLVALVGLLAGSPTRKVQTARCLFSPTIVSNRRFSSDIIKNIPCGIFYFWWPWSDSNRHSLQNLILSQARLPIPPRGRTSAIYYFTDAFLASTFFTKRALRVAL